VDPGEEPRAAAIRELVEETGYEPLDVRELAVASAAGNSSTRQFHIYGARGARKVGEPVDLHEAAGLRWMPRSELQDALMAGEFREAASLLAGLMADASGLFDPI
ncbi:MAG: NUDIX hydrolase, partial [Myxococcales bacterium]|nr:NUDIX hydrolase [Myxococcales bacterium]